MKLKEVQKLATGGVIDADAPIGYVIKPLKHFQCTAQFGVVALFNEREKTWHRTVTMRLQKSARRVLTLLSAVWDWPTSSRGNAQPR